METTSYVTYDADGNLSGAYLQTLRAEHANNHIMVSDEMRLRWPSYRANDARDGLELLPPVEPPQPTEAEIMEGYEVEVERHLDAVARSMGYRTIFTAISFADDPTNAKWQTEGAALRTWRSAVWLKCHGVLNSYKAGEIPAPTYAELINELPAAPVAV